MRYHDSPSRGPCDTLVRIILNTGTGIARAGGQAVGVFVDQMTDSMAFLTPSGRRLARYACGGVVASSGDSGRRLAR